MGQLLRLGGFLRVRTTLFVALVLVLACGENATKPDNSGERIGRFLDGSVEGLSYETGSLSETTGADGSFSFKSGSVVRFRIGDIEIGSGIGKSIMTPLDLISGATDETDPSVTNICRLMLTLDDDADAANGITITEALRTAALGRSIDFMQTPAAFGSDQEVVDVVEELTSLTTAGKRPLVSQSEAQSHLRSTLLGIFSGTYAGTYVGGDTGYWTIIVDPDGNVTGMVHSADGDEYTCTGLVTSSGNANFAEGEVSVCGGEFSGIITTEGAIDGTWICASYPEFYGTFSGQKEDDTIPPAAVGDLSAAAVSGSSVTLQWTAPGDDGNTGTAAQYDIRYATTAGASWGEMTQATGEPLPAPAGQSEVFVVTGLSPNTTYYFLMKTADEVPNWSAVSNMASATTSEQGDTMVLVPAGTFTMGDGVADCGTQQHQVTLTHSFYMNRYEVTNRVYCDAVQWAYDHGYVTATSSSVRDNLDGSTQLLAGLSSAYCKVSFENGTFTVTVGAEDYPMTRVTWFGAAAFCDWLSMEEGYPRAYDHSTWTCNDSDPYGAEGYRLPTDAEWEYAAQYDDERVYPWGNEAASCQRANYYRCVGGLRSVGSYPAAPTALGLYDMAGNMPEWCNDWYVCDLGTLAQADPTGPGSGSERVCRGGSWSQEDSSLRCSFREGVSPSLLTYYYSFGFRYARSQ